MKFLELPDGSYVDTNYVAKLEVEDGYEKGIRIYFENNTTHFLKTDTVEEAEDMLAELQGDIEAQYAPSNNTDDSYDVNLNFVCKILAVGFAISIVVASCH